MSMDIIAQIAARLREIAANGGHRSLIDTEDERQSARLYLRGMVAKTAKDSDERDLITEALDKFSRSNYLTVGKPNFRGKYDQILRVTSYLGNAADRLLQIAKKGGRPHAIDSEAERREALGYLRSIKLYLEEGERQVVGNTIDGLYNSGPGFQVDPLPFTPVPQLDLDKRLASGFYSRLTRTLNPIDETLGYALPSGAYALLKSSHVACRRASSSYAAKSGEDFICSEPRFHETFLSKSELDKLMAPLGKAVTPGDERLALLRVIRGLASFPHDNDCVQQAWTSGQIMWLAHVGGYLKFHRFDLMDGSSLCSKAFRHFASGIVDEASGETWMIDTWATQRIGRPIIMPFDEWKEKVF